uniref:Uncharacterized protein n=1 Tax=Amphilophus citrinellus TaxID=61819 RepID=A0A3Q0SGJ9_AMPCI
CPFDPSPSYENFLASKPARSILKEVTGGMRGRQRGRDCESQTDVSVTVHSLNLVDKVKRLGVAGAPGGRAMSTGPILGPLGGLRRSGSPFGPDGMRRNRSYPVCSTHYKCWSVVGAHYSQLVNPMMY